MSTLDTTIVFTYLIALFCWAMYVGRRETADDFLVFSRRAPFLLVLASIVSTWVGAGTTVATAAAAYDKGISLGLTAACGGALGMIVAVWFAPRLKSFGDRHGAYTIGDLYTVRFSRNSAMLASCVVSAVYLLLTAAQFVALGSLVTVWSGFSFESVVCFAAISTVIYTAFAGIKSDFYTDGIHFVVMVITIIMVLLPSTLREVGGFEGLAKIPVSYYDPFAHGGVSFFIAGLLFGGGSVFVTMELWQRIYASVSGRAAQWALAISIPAIVLFYAVSVILGLAGTVLLPDLPDRDQVIFLLMNRLLPSGLLGLGVAGLVAVFISTLNSTIMVASATISQNIYSTLWTDKVTDEQRLRTGRVVTLLCGVSGMLIAFGMRDLVALSVNSLFMLLILLPSVVGGFYWRRATSIGAMSSIGTGLVVTVGFMFIDSATAFVPGFITSLIVFVGVSLFTKHDSGEQHVDI